MNIILLPTIYKYVICIYISLLTYLLYIIEYGHTTFDYTYVSLKARKRYNKKTYILPYIAGK